MLQYTVLYATDAYQLERAMNKAAREDGYVAQGGISVAIKLSGDKLFSVLMVRDNGKNNQT